MTININAPEVTYSMTEDGDFLCDHNEAEIERACCSGRDSEGNPSCACHGQDAVWCPNPDCTGLTDNDVERILDYGEEY